MSTPEAQLLSDAILSGFERYFEKFQEITLAAKARFRRADVRGCHAASKERLNLYLNEILALKEHVIVLTDNAVCESKTWKEARSLFAASIEGHPLAEIAETFYNSVYCKFFDHLRIDNDHMFVLPSVKPLPSGLGHNKHMYNYYYSEGSIVEILSNILDSYDFGVPWEDKARDVNSMLKAAMKAIPGTWLRNQDAYVIIHKSIFYRGMAAYMVGMVKNGEEHMPFVVPVMHNGTDGIFVDSLIFDSDQLSVIFSFTRAYFKVDTEAPAEVVAFLHDLMPWKSHAELYNSIGFNRHGKTEFYRHFLNHLDNTDDEFIIAPGVKGMVMSVFTLPSLDIVFKIIKDTFAKPKEMTKAVVKDRYMLVSRHDRVGRMADTQEYSNFNFPKHRFSKELLDELLTVAPSLIEIEGDNVLIKHIYTERRMIPLNIYFEDANEQEIRHAADEYGLAIKQLAAANIFPGDMLFKNFGVTRHGRVVFYDYDEIALLTECNFRKIPPPRTPEDELSAEPWYSVAPNDVFPEEFRTFLLASNRKVRKIFEELHSEIFDADWWKSLQYDILNGKTRDVLPYQNRFERRHIPTLER